MGQSASDKDVSGLGKTLTRFPLAAILVFAAAVVLSPLRSEFLTLEFWQKHWGDVISLGGLCLAFVGFLWTLWIATQSRSAASLAERAANEARESIGHVDAVIELAAATTSIRGVMESFREQHWNSVPLRIEQARMRLVAVQSRGRLSKLQEVTIASVITQLVDVEDQIDKYLIKRKLDKPPHRHVAMLTILRNQNEALQLLLEQLRRGEISK